MCRSLQSVGSALSVASVGNCLYRTLGPPNAISALTSNLEAGNRWKSFYTEGNVAAGVCVSHFKTRATLHTFDKSLKFCVYFCRSGADPQFPIAPSLTLWRNCVSISGEKGYTNFFTYTPCVPLFEFLPHSLASPSTSGTSPSFSSTLQFLLISPVFKYPLHPQI